MICNVSIGSNFLDEIQDLYIRMALRLQAAMEDRHAEVYSLAVNLFIGNEKQVDEIRDKTESMAPVKEKIAWIQKYTNSEKYNFATRVLAMAIIEGIFFQGKQRHAATPRQRCAVVSHFFLTFRFYILYDGTA